MAGTKGIGIAGIKQDGGREGECHRLVQPRLFRTPARRLAGSASASLSEKVILK